MTDVFKAKVMTMATGIEDEAEDARLRSSVCKVLGASALWTTNSMNSRSGKSVWHLKGGTLASAPGRHELSVPTVNTAGWTLDVRVTLDCATGTCMVVLGSLHDASLGPPTFFCKSGNMRRQWLRNVRFWTCWHVTSSSYAPCHPST